MTAWCAIRTVRPRQAGPPRPRRMPGAVLRALLAGAAALAAIVLPPPVRAAELLTFNIEAKAGRFHPERITVPAGVRFRIVVTNRGPGPEEFESLELKKETVLAPGVSRNVVFAPLKPGVYRFFGEFHPDTARGEIVVVDKGAVSGP